MDAPLLEGSVTAPQVSASNPWHIGQSRIYILPSSSAANATMRYDEKLQWWANLARPAK